MDYNKLLEKAREAYKNAVTGAEKRRLKSIFPELAESEDEKIRKALIELVKQSAEILNKKNQESMLAWLEKQDDYNRLVEEIKERKELISKEKEKVTSTNDKLSLGGRIAILEELLAFTKEKQGEHKLIDSYCQENCKGFQETGKCYADGECKAKRDAEQNPVWSEEDEKILGKCIDAASGYYSPEDKQSMKDWLKSLKERVQPKQNQEWSEEDEKIFNEIFSVVAKALSRKCTLFGESYDYIKWQNWLKSLKPQPQWKPTKEQLNFLIGLSDNPGLYLEERNSLKEIYEQLNKL